MDINQLETFLVVCEERNLSRAAVRLFLTQPAVTRQIQNLEAALGCRLLERTPRGVAPTVQGEELRARGVRILEELRSLREIGKGSEGISGELNVACSDTVACHFLAPILGRFAQECPRVRIHLENSVTPGIVNLVERGACELGFVLLPVRNSRLEIHPVLNYHHVAVFAPHEEPDGGGPMELATMCAMPLVLLTRDTATRRAFDEMVASKGLMPARVLDVGNVSAQKALVRVGLGAGILPDYAIEPRDGLTTRPIQGAHTKTLAFCHLRTRPLSPPAARLVEMLS
ncbi:LysR family transcriptional regulator [Holophaga foetida]|uniref:LysR family transcriptional regulator n=1 Tax=Holophaga foetida TaxID=35839 RepID=UPI0002473F4C|nr:LysR family transcriptional regulator [Holophaga foetida]